MPRSMTVGIERLASDLVVRHTSAVEVSDRTCGVGVCMYLDLHRAWEIGIDSEMKIHDCRTVLLPGTTRRVGNARRSQCCEVHLKHGRCAPGSHGASWQTPSGPSGS